MGRNGNVEASGDGSLEAGSHAGSEQINLCLSRLCAVVGCGPISIGPVQAVVGHPALHTEHWDGCFSCKAHPSTQMQTRHDLRLLTFLMIFTCGAKI